jgi:hypothetical protein
MVPALPRLSRLTPDFLTLSYKAGIRAAVSYSSVCTLTPIFFNTNVEMPVGNLVTDANRPMFMGCYPICTEHGARALFRRIFSTSWSENDLVRPPIV